MLSVLDISDKLYPWPEGNGAGLTPLQREIFFDVLRNQYRQGMILGGERGGKSFLLALLLAALSGPVDVDGKSYTGETYWLVGPDYRQARPEFTYIYEILNEMGQIESYSMPENQNQPWGMTTTWGTKFETRTSSDVTKLASFSVNGVGMCEASQQSDAVRLKLRGRTAQTRGFVYMAGTLEKGLPWYASTFRKWQRYNRDEEARSFKLPTWSNLSIFPGGEEDPEIEALRRDYPADLFAERFGAEPQSRYGLVIPEFDPVKHIVEIVPMLSTDMKPITDGQMPFYTDLPVEMAYDPGTHTAALWFVQRQGKLSVFLDSVYIKNVLVQDFIPEVKKSPYWEYARRSQGHVADRAVNQQHHNKSVAVIWQEEAQIQWNSVFIKEERWLWETMRYRLSTNNVYETPLMFFADTNPFPEPTPDGWAPAAMTEFQLWKWPDRIFNPDAGSTMRPIDSNNDAMKAAIYHQIYYYGVNQGLNVRRQVKKRPYYRDYSRKAPDKSGKIIMGVRI